MAQTIDFQCPRCGTTYHADKSHIGKQIRCTHGDCHEVITVYRQENYSYSNQQLRTDSKQQPDVVTANEPHRRTPVVRRVNWERRIAFASIAVLLIAVGWAGYYFGVRRQEAKSNSVTDSHERFAHHENTHREEPAQVPHLSSRDVEVADSVSVSGEQASQPSAGAEFGNDANPPASSSNPFYPSTSNPFYTGATASPPANVPWRPMKSHTTQAHERPARSLPTGTRIIPDQATSGDGELEAVNGTFLDACVMVVETSSQTRVREVSVQANGSFLLEHLDPGNYQMVFATGKDWDDRGERFNRDASYFEFGKVLSFRQDQSSYERHTITLNTVPNGNVPRRRISEAEFHALSGKP